MADPVAPEDMTPEMLEMFELAAFGKHFLAIYDICALIEKSAKPEDTDAETAHLFKALRSRIYQYLAVVSNQDIIDTLILAFIFLMDEVDNEDLADLRQAASMVERLDEFLIPQGSSTKQMLADLIDNQKESPITSRQEGEPMD